MRARLVSFLFCVFALFSAADAADRRGPSLDRVLPQIRQSVPGTFYDAEGPYLSPDGQATYRIKWMTPDGRIIWFAVDARSGQILGGAPYSTGRAPYRRDDEPPPRFRPEDNPRYGDRNNGWGRRPDDGDDHGYSRGRDRDQDNNQGSRGRRDGHSRRPDR